MGVHFGSSGTVTDIGSTLGRISMIYLRKGCRRSRLDDVERAEIGVDARKLAVLMGLWVFYFIGGVLGLYAENKLPGPHALLAPASVTGSLGIFYMTCRHVLKSCLAVLANSFVAALLQSCPACGLSSSDRLSAKVGAGEVLRGSSRSPLRAGKHGGSYQGRGSVVTSLSGFRGLKYSFGPAFGRMPTPMPLA